MKQKVDKVQQRKSNKIKLIEHDILGFHNMFLNGFSYIYNLEK